MKTDNGQEIGSYEGSNGITMQDMFVMMSAGEDIIDELEEWVTDQQKMLKNEGFEKHQRELILGHAMIRLWSQMEFNIGRSAATVCAMATGVIQTTFEEMGKEHEAKNARRASRVPKRNRQNKPKDSKLAETTQKLTGRTKRGPGRPPKSVEATQ